MSAAAIFPHPCEDVTRRVHGASRAGGLLGWFVFTGKESKAARDGDSSRNLTCEAVALFGRPNSGNAGELGALALARNQGEVVCRFVSHDASKVETKRQGYN